MKEEVEELLINPLRTLMLVGPGGSYYDLAFGCEATMMASKLGEQHKTRAVCGARVCPIKVVT